jgi:hypothetical protein
LVPALSSSNFIAGLHVSVQTPYSGTGLSSYDSSSWFGSRGKLLGVNLLDAYSRGIYSGNATHELTHQWAAYLSISGLVDGTGHYNPRSSAASLVGGFLWVPNPDGSYTVNCNEGRNGATEAPPLDRYLMGLIDGSRVPPVRAYKDSISVVDKCDQPVQPGEISAEITIQEIQQGGARTPGPAAARHDFSLGFVAESKGRVLNPTEMTFYDALADYYTKVLPANTPSPYVGFNWVPMTDFFREGTMWRSDLGGVMGADVDFSGTVDCDDVNVVTASFGHRVGQVEFDGRADINRDGVVDVRDLAAVTQKLPLGTRCR